MESNRLDAFWLSHWDSKHLSDADRCVLGMWGRCLCGAMPGLAETEPWNPGRKLLGQAGTRPLALTEPGEWEKADLRDYWGVGKDRHFDWVGQGEKEVIRAGSEFGHTHVWTLVLVMAGILFNFFKPWPLRLHTDSDNTAHFMALLVDEIRQGETKTCSPDTGTKQQCRITLSLRAEKKEKLKMTPMFSAWESEQRLVELIGLRSSRAY